MSETIARRLVAHGRVQGVWFRESMRRKAETLGVTGWVRNRMDGSVEALVQGPPDAVEAMVEWARRGPERANVARLDVETTGAQPLASFETRPTQ
ncbi:MAG: acylphosphatase [Bacillota bacterium]